MIEWRKTYGELGGVTNYREDGQSLTVPVGYEELARWLDRNPLCRPCASDGPIYLTAAQEALRRLQESEGLREALARAYQLVGQIEALHGDTKQVEALDFLVEALDD